MELLRKYATIFYSTHILDDVQRVSDTVAILDNGELITHGPIEDLLTGSGKTEFIVKIKGNTTGIQKLILEQSWVTQTQATEMNGETTLVVSVNDSEKAETQLARLFLVDETIVMTEFRRKTYELEEIFMEIVEGGRNVRE
jgi:ABC-2 type transport system ATP-binding protein